jgi:uncharacterized iron-regulated membrane protein
MGAMTARRLWLQVHLYLGLVAGLAFAILGLTGSILVFSDEIDRAWNPQLTVTQAAAGADRVSPDRALAVVERHAGIRPYMLELPIDEHDAYLAFVNEGDGESERLRAVLVDTGSDAVLADRAWGSSFVSFARRLHTSLFADDVGNWIVGAFGVLGLVSLLTGLYLWWPRGGAWRRALAFHGSRRATTLNYELHRIGGFYLLVVLFVVSLSGVYLAVPAPFTAVAGAFAQLVPYPEQVPVTPSPGAAEQLSLAELANLVEQRTPGAVVTGFHLPPAPAEAATVYYRDPVEPRSEFGRSALWMDRYTGRIVHERRYVSLGATDRLFALQILLHNGEIAGRAGEWLVFLSGIALPMLFGTGCYLWWVKRRPRRKPVPG